MECLLVVGMEATPVDGVELEHCYPAGVEEDLAAGVELAMVADHIGLVSHAFPGRLVDEFDQLLLGKLALGGWTYIFFAQLIAEVKPVLVDESWQGSPDVTLGIIDIPDDCCHLLCLGETVDIHKLLVFL